MTKIVNARILNEDCTAFSEGELAFENGIITHVAKTVDVACDDVIDARGAYVLPGFKNAHTHSAMTFLRSRADDEPLSAWLNGTVLPREALLTDEDVYWLTRLAILEYLQGGTTLCFDMYFHTDAFAEACIDSGFRAVLCGSATAYENDPIGCVRRLWEDNTNKHPLLSVVLGFHAEYTTNEGLLKELSALAHELCSPVFMHISETEEEVAGCVERHGVTPAVYFDSLSLFDFGGGGFHCTHFTDADMEVFLRRGLYAVSCPASNLKLASGIAPLAEFARRGIPVALGTDGAASNNALDMFREMYLAATLQKVREKDAAALDAACVLKGAVQTGARAVGRWDCDGIAVGKCADLVFVRADDVNLSPKTDSVKSLVYSGGVQNVCRTVVAGKTLYCDGEFFAGEDVDTIRKKCGQIARRIESRF